MVPAPSWLPLTHTNERTSKSIQEPATDSFRVGGAVRWSDVQSDDEEDDELLTAAAAAAVMDSSRQSQQQRQSAIDEQPSRFANDALDHGMCLTMHQPWASLLVHGFKRAEGRSWSTEYQGRSVSQSVSC